MDQEPTTPNVARVYDYLLGGNHNFAADRASGDWLIADNPLVVQRARLNPLFLEYVVEDMVEAGLSSFLDLATGLPTEGAVHERVPESARIVYNDHDPDVVAYSRQIIGDRPNIRYVESKIENIETILAVAEDAFGSDRRVGISLIGVVYFIGDESLRHVFQRLYKWAAPGSLLAVTTFQDENRESSWTQGREMYRRMGTEVYPRHPTELLELTGGWEPYKQGFQGLEDIVERELQRTLAFDTDRGQLGYGGVLVRP